ECWRDNPLPREARHVGGGGTGRDAETSASLFAEKENEKSSHLIFFSLRILLPYREVPFCHFQKCQFGTSSLVSPIFACYFGLLDPAAQGVDVGASQSPALLFQVAGLLQLFHEAHRRALGDAEVLGERFLAGKAAVLLPGVAQEHRVAELGAGRQAGVAQHDVGHLGKAMGGDGVEPFENDLLVLGQCAADVLHYASSFSISRARNRSSASRISSLDDTFLPVFL